MVKNTQNAKSLQEISLLETREGLDEGGPEINAYKYIHGHILHNSITPCKVISTLSSSKQNLD